MIVPCSVKISLYACADRTCPFGLASWMRMSRAKTPPITKNENELIR
jgi:hypothetical protein